jgi:hypothetical protein
MTMHNTKHMLINDAYDDSVTTSLVLMRVTERTCYLAISCTTQETRERNIYNCYKNGFPRRWCCARTQRPDFLWSCSFPTPRLSSPLITSSLKDSDSPTSATFASVQTHNRTVSMETVPRSRGQSTELLRVCFSRCSLYASPWVVPWSTRRCVALCCYLMIDRDTDQMPMGKSSSWKHLLFWSIYSTGHWVLANW